MKRLLFIILLMVTICHFDINAQVDKSDKSRIKLARVKYSGGGDWYNDPSAEVNLLNYVAKNTNIPVDPTYEYVDLSSDNLYSYPIIFITGHGNLNFSDAEVRNLRSYLQNGGFLYIDDDYGLDEFVRREMKKVFPGQEFAELPFNHGIYSSHFKFSSGAPKIHEHDDKAPRGFGLFNDGRLCVFYTFETNPSDGWADPEIHKDTPERRESALKFGTNIIVWALTN